MSEKDTAEAKLSRAQKKNKKRAEKRLNHRVDQRVSQNQEPEVIQQCDPVEVLKELLAEAKAANDHKLAAKLRQDLWVLQDACAGVRPELASDDLNTTLARISRVVELSSQPSNNGQIVQASPPPKPSFSKDDKVHCEKRLKALHKKLSQIQAIKVKKADGEPLDDGQLTKINKESEVLAEIEEIESSLKAVSL